MLDFSTATTPSVRIHVPISARKVSEVLGGVDALSKAIRTQHPDADEAQLKRIFAGEEDVAIVPDHPFLEIKLVAQVRDELGDPGTAGLVKERLAAVGNENAQNTAASAVLKISRAGGDWRYARAAISNPEAWPKWASLPLADRVDLAAELERTVMAQMFAVLSTAHAAEEDLLGKCLSL